MTRKECLEQAMGCVLQDRASQYGGVEDNFRTIANFWSVYLGRKVYPADVAAMMALLKIARAKANPKHGDNWVDLAGYAACGAECANVELYPWQKEVMGTATPEPEFQRGDKVEVQVMPDSSTWASATIMAVYRDKDTCEWRYCVDFDEDDWAHVMVPSARVRPVSVPKAEGCEALVEKDAPQTPQELYQHIVDCNPATFHAPSYAEEQLEHHSRLQAHKPTGEELAEMAEEEKHG